MHVKSALCSIALLTLVLGGARWAGAQTFRVHTAPAGIELPFHTIFYQGDPAYQDLPLAQLPLREPLVAVIPPIQGTFGMADLRCTGIGRDRHLRGCVVTVEPTGRGYEAAAAAIARQLVVDPAFRLEHRPPTRFMSIQLKMWRSDVPVINGPCWPPSCSPILPPPSPVTP
jgi:hypothetical protein